MTINDFEEYEFDFTGNDSKKERIGAPIDYENPEEVANLMAKHLAKVFIATHKRKIEKELDKLRAKCK